jgi:hypothetical protein
MLRIWTVLLSCSRVVFSGELLIKWQLAGFKKIEIPVRHFPRQFGVQTGASLRVIFKMFGECWQLKQELQAESLNPVKTSHLAGHKPHALVERSR